MGGRREKETGGERHRVDIPGAIDLPPVHSRRRYIGKTRTGPSRSWGLLRVGTRHTWLGAWAVLLVSSWVTRMLGEKCWRMSGQK